MEEYNPYNDKNVEITSENIQKLLNDGIDVDKRIHECWNILFEKNRSKLFELPKNVKTLFNNKSKNINVFREAIT
jgi:hypothetical protein